MGFDIKRAESIANGFKEWIHTGRKTCDDAVKQIKETYREDMAREIIRILEHDIKEVEAKCRWALVFDNVEEVKRAREKLSWVHIYPDSQVGNKLLWIDKETAEIARQVAGGLIETWTPRASPVYEAPRPGEEVGPPRPEERPLLPPTPENAKENIRRVIRPRLEETAKTKISVRLGYSYDRGELEVDREKYSVGQVSLTGFGDTVKEELEKVFGALRYVVGGFREETFENEKVVVDYYASFGYLNITVKPK